MYGQREDRPSVDQEVQSLTQEGGLTVNVLGTCGAGSERGLMVGGMQKKDDRARGDVHEAVYLACKQGWLGL